jgi:S-formylglutathione hydrolase
LENPILVKSAAERRRIFDSFWPNLLYAQAAAFSPNPDKPPFFADLPVQYPEKTLVNEIWQKWLEQDLVSQIGRDGKKLINTSIFIDIGVGPVTVMEEMHGIADLRTALDEEKLVHTFLESPGDHLSHLRERTAEALKFLSDPDSYLPPDRKSDSEPEK